MTPEEFEDLALTERLGYLTGQVPIQPYEKEEDVLKGTVKLSLSEVYRHTEDTISICVFGKVLYRHFDTPYSGMISDFDIMVIKDGPEDNIVLPESKDSEKILEPEVESRWIRYGYEDIIKYTAVKTRTPYRVDRNFWEYLFNDLKHKYTEGAIPLHITYRTPGQLLSGIGNGDTVSESAIRYGVPFVGEGSFYKLVDETSIERNALHEIQWETLDQKVSAFIS